jgi:hypothetical protein
LPVDGRAGLRRRGLDGKGDLLASQRGGARCLPSTPPLDGEDLVLADPVPLHP